MTTRNPNLDSQSAGINQTGNATTPTWQNQYFRNLSPGWFTGIPPSDCPGFRTDGVLGSLTQPRLDTCTRSEVLSYFNNTWTLTEVLFSALVSDDVFYRTPYHGLRHPLIFYYGHPAVLYVNKLRIAGILKAPFNEYFESIFETGVDEMSWDDMSKNDMKWPAVSEVTAYRKQVYESIKKVILTHPALDDGHKFITQESSIWALFMGFEHERIHLETSSVLMRELPLSSVWKPLYWPNLHFHPSRTRGKTVAPEFPTNNMIPVPQARVCIGKKKDDPFYGWDNEYGYREVAVPETRVSQFLVSNGEFLEFVRSGGYNKSKYWAASGWQWREFRNVKWPNFWISDGPQGAHEYKLRTIFEAIDMPWDWPVIVNYYEAKAFCAWKSEQTHKQLRLPTEAEHHLMRSTMPSADASNLNSNSNLNLNLKWGSETSVDASLTEPQLMNTVKNGPIPADVFGNSWQWCEDHFHPLAGFEVHPFYEDFSTPCFDGRHQMIMGGSFVSTGDEASHWARFHFRPHFFQHAGIRMVEGEPVSSVHISKQPKSLQDTQASAVSQTLQAPHTSDLEKRESDFSHVTHIIEKYLSEFSTMPPAGQDFDFKTEKTRSDFVTPFDSTTTLPELGTHSQKLFQTLFQDMARGPQKPGHPRYFAYLAGATDPLAALAQAAGMILNPFATQHALAAFCIEMEREVINWFCQLFKLPNTAYGLLTTGSSLAILSALNAARFSRLKPSESHRARIYISENGHHSVAKASAFSGFPSECIVRIPVSASHYELDIDILKKQIADDIRAGFIPFVLVGTAGTTYTGQVDPLATLANIAQEYNIWFHVDAAYGGPFQLTGFGFRLFEGIEQADSLNFDFHKSFSMPYGTGCLLVRDKKTLQIPFLETASYMPPTPNDPMASFDSADFGPELSRDFRALRVWLPIKARGIAYYRNQLEQKRILAIQLFQRLSQNPRLTIVHPDLTVVAFHAGSATHDLQKKMNSRGKVFLSGCTLKGLYFIRVCVLSHLTTEQDVDICLQEIEAVLESVTSHS